MTSVNEKDIRDIAGYLFTLGGGPESGLRVHERALLGNPDTGEIEVALEDAGAPGWVWLHQQGVPYPTTDEEGVQEDIPGAVFTAVLPPHIRKSLNLKLGLPVRFRMVDGRNEVIGADGAPAAEYEYNSAGVSARDPVDRRQLDWLLIRPQDPPGRGVVLGGGVVRIGDTMYNLPVLELQDIITGNIGGLDTGQALAVLITQDTTDLTDSGVTLTAGSAFTDNRATNGISDHAALFGDYPDTANDEDIVYGWVKLYAGMDTVRAEDIYPALDTGGGSGGGAVDASSVTYTADDVGNWDGPPDDAAEALDELAGRVETLEAGSSGGVTQGVKLFGPDGSGSGFQLIASTALNDLEWAQTVYDTSAYYNGTVNPVLFDGNFLITAGGRFFLDDTATTGGPVIITLDSPLDGEAAGEQGGFTYYVTPGQDGSFYVHFNLVMTGNVDVSNNLDTSVKLWNQCDVGVWVDYCWIEAKRMGDHLATP